MKVLLIWFLLSTTVVTNAFVCHPATKFPRKLTSSSSKTEPTKTKYDSKLLRRLASSLSQTAAARKATSNIQSNINNNNEIDKNQFFTFLRLAVSSVISGVVAYLAFPALALWLASRVNGAGVFAVLSTDSSQFVQNFLTVAGLLFSILVGQTYVKQINMKKYI
jgi:hypothetical protein